jgi:type VI secretion system protein VasG
MAEISRANLFRKLNDLAYQSINSATSFCKMRGDSYVELAHWLHQILQLQDSDLHRIVKHFDLNISRLAADITSSLEMLQRRSTAVLGFSFQVEYAVERGWTYATLLFGEPQIRTGYLLVGLLKTDDAIANLRAALLGISREFEKIKLEVLTERFDAIVGDSPENDMTSKDGFRLEGSAAAHTEGDISHPAGAGKQEALRKFTVDLTEQARNGEIDPIVGRDEEIRQIVDILMRRRQNNPILTGEAGVGKTAVVEGFAHRIVAGDVPPSLQDVSVRVLDIGLLQAGASLNGEFELRLRAVIDDVQASPKPFIIFIDEAHTLIGAGGAAGTGEAANLLKPALARGTLRTIAATTWAEYKKHIEKDPALTRRFQVVQVPEPSEEKCVLMMRNVASIMEQHHKVQILDEALEAAVKLSHRYIPARQLPDKAVSLLDTASARVAISLHAVPAEVEDSRRRIEALQTELKIIAREQAVGIDASVREQRASQALIEERDVLEQLDARWQSEKTLVDEILELRARLRGHSEPVEGTGSELEQAVAEEQTTDKAADAGPDTEQTPAAGPEPKLTEEQRLEMLGKLQNLQGQLSELQGESPLLLPSVDAQAVASVVADWTGIPVGRMVKNEIETVLNLAKILSRRVIGQDHAMQMITRRIQTSRAALDNPNKPVGVFMLCGPSGVGKTETALTLAEALYGGEHNVITINMSEFQEAHTVSTLKGAPPGYVGYGEGGILTEAVRRKPYSVVLLDEVEKAHSDVHEIFFQVFDKGQMEDGEGRMIDFKNTLILLTSNVGSDLIMNMCKDPELMPEPEGIAQALREPLLKVFPAALLGRLVVIPYYPLSDSMVADIAKLQLGRIEKRIKQNYDIPFSYDDDVIKLIVDRCNELESGGRMIDAILTNTMLPAISQEFLTKMMEGEKIEGVRVDVIDGEFSYGFGRS